MNVSAVMDELANRLESIAGLRVYAFPVDNIQPPAAVVGFPDTYTYDETYGRGADRISLPIFAVVARTSDRVARDRLSVYMNGSGAKSFKAALDDGPYTALDTARVTSVEFAPFTAAGVDYWSAMFNVDVFGKGA